MGRWRTGRARRADLLDAAFLGGTAAHGIELDDGYRAGSAHCGCVVIPALLGGPNALMIGRVLWDEFFSNRAWPVASAVAILLLVLLVPFMMWYQSVQARESAGAR